jgi:hypothetical protein
LDRHADEWRADLPKALRGDKAVFHRGFVEELCLPVPQLLKVSARVWARHPIRELSPEDATGKLAQVLALPGIARIRTLYLREPLGGPDLAALAATDKLSGLRDLSVKNRSRDQTAEALARCPSLRGLTGLSLSDPFSDRAMTAGGLATLAASDNGANLKSLHLDMIHVGPDGTRALARSPRLAGLTKLTIVNHSRDEGFSALAGSPHLAGLRWLSLRNSRVGVPGAEALASTRHLTRLRILMLDKNPLGPAGIRALARAEWTELARLDVGRCGLGDEGAAAIAGCRTWPPLTSLSVAENDITAEGARALARSPLLRDVVYLNLYLNKIGDAGAMALCEGGILEKVQKLDLAGSGPFSASVKQALQDRFGAGVRLA